MATSYKAPLDDMRFVLNEVLNVSQLAKLDSFKDNMDLDTVNGSLEMVAQMSEEILTPLNAVGDQEGCTYDAKTRSVKTPKGFKEAYKQFADVGLTSFTCDPQYGGLGMPQVVNTAISEMVSSANLAFGLYPGLSHGVYTAMAAVANEEQKQTYLPKLVSGEWSGSMCLTEPDSGTDLGLIKTKAVKQPDGSYKLTGTKIFISAGDHDLTKNTVHLVLARIEDPSTPEGIKGISLFAVPKFDPETKARNSVYPARIEEKMGLHGNSTCEMSFEGATGQLVGEANKGMKGMFIMMNEERLGVGLQGLGLSEVAYQNALEYALTRVQSQPIDQDPKNPKRATIIQHPDVRRELLSIKATVEGERMLAYWTALQLDLAHNAADEAQRKQAQNLVELLTPVVKAHLTDNAELNTSSAVQVWGGHGYIAENGMEQFSRDARITRLYEGTNGIQALDLIGRKVLQQNLLPGYLAQVEADLKAAKASGLGSEFTKPVEEAVKTLKKATLAVKGGRKGMLKMAFQKIRGQKIDFGPTLVEAAAASTDYLKLTSLVAMGHMWVKMADVAQQQLNAGAKNADFYETKLQTGRFYMQKVMPQALTLAQTIRNGAETLLEMPADKFAHKAGSVGVEAREAVPVAAAKKQAPKK